MPFLKAKAEAPQFSQKIFVTKFIIFYHARKCIIVKLINVGARNRRKAAVKIRRNPQLRILFMIYIFLYQSIYLFIYKRLSIYVYACVIPTFFWNDIRVAVGHDGGANVVFDCDRAASGLSPVF